MALRFANPARFQYDFSHEKYPTKWPVVNPNFSLMNPKDATSFSRLLIVITAVGYCLFALSVYASEKTQKQAELEALQTKIGNLKSAIDVKESSKSQYTSQLKDIERDFANISRKIRTSEKEINSKAVEMKKLKRSRNKHQQQLVHENDILAKQVYAAFTLGEQEKLKLLFSPGNPGELQRNLVYYQYFSEARADLIETVKTNIDAILETEVGINNTKLELENRHQLLRNQKTQLDQDKSKRHQIISSLDQQLKKQGGDLNRLEDEASQLQKLISSIAEILVETPEPKLDTTAFAKLRGQLAWPVDGKVKKLFGHQKPLSNLRWQGIMIYAPAGNHVRAVSHGRVAFADWLRGLGYLIIIDHGNSYLSLYGHNESVFKMAGDWVESGDIIGSIGSSGGQQKPGLYFEIRKQGKPQNPTRWCKTGNKFNS
jgi:septal ring factor EnvC (AmiA/AmiB activator)